MKKSHKTLNLCDKKSQTSEIMSTKMENFCYTVSQTYGTGYT